MESGLRPDGENKGMQCKSRYRFKTYILNCFLHGEKFRNIPLWSCLSDNKYYSWKYKYRIYAL